MPASWRAFLADDRLGPAATFYPGDIGDEVADRIEPLRADAHRLVMEVIAPRLDRHHDLFEGRVAGPLAQAVDGALDLASASVDGRQAVGNPQSQIVVTVVLKNGPIDVRHMLPQILKDVAILLRDGVADGVRNIDCRRAGRNGPFDNLAQKIELRAGRVFRREFDIRTIVDGPFDHLDRLANDLLPLAILSLYCRWMAQAVDVIVAPGNSAAVVGLDCLSTIASEAERIGVAGDRRRQRGQPIHWVIIQLRLQTVWCGDGGHVAGRIIGVRRRLIANQTAVSHRAQTVQFVIGELDQNPIDMIR